jgi:Resolvase, N terminal domain
VILVWKLDRWDCSLVDVLTTLDARTALWIGFVPLTEALDRTTPAGRAFAGFLAGCAECERGVIRERIKAGMRDARTRGKAHGRPRAKTTMRRRCGYRRSKACVIGKRAQAGAHVVLARVACHGCHHAVVHQRSMARLRHTVLDTSGAWDHPPRQGRQRASPPPQRRPPPSLQYAQVVKRR